MKLTQISIVILCMSAEVKCSETKEMKTLIAVDNNNMDALSRTDFKVHVKSAPPILQIPFSISSLSIWKNCDCS